MNLIPKKVLNISNKKRPKYFESYDRAKTKETAAKFFMKNNYMFGRVLGSGAFGDVIVTKK